MKLRRITVGAFEVNAYLVWNETTSKGIIIDPGDEASRIIQATSDEGLEPIAIVLTHGHGDHIAAVEEVKNHYDIPLYVGKGDQELLKNPSANVSAMVGHPIVAPEPEHLMSDEQQIELGGVGFTVMSTPGHTPGGVCLLFDKGNFVVTGDTLFFGSIGRTDLPGGNLGTLLHSIKTKLLVLPDEIVCYPGHGPETTIGSERVNNPFLIDGFMA